MIFLKTFFFFHLLFFAEGEQYLASLPKTLYALRGFCVVIPCSFDIPDFESKLNKSGSVHGFWIKGGVNFAQLPVVFNGTANITRLFERIEITGDLHKKDCTTIFYNVNQSHADKYHFRIETIELYTFTESFDLTVEDTPGSPQVSEWSEVSEETSVTLTCTAAAPCPSQPPTITWSLLSGNTHTHIQEEKNGNRSLVSFLNFTASPSHHGRQIYCTASYPRQSGSTVEANSTVQILTVLFSPVEVVVSVSPPGPAAEGSSVTLTCNSSEANPPVQNYTWFRGGQQAQHTPIASGQTLTFNLSSSDEGLYYCRAEHPQGGKESAEVTLVIKEDKRDFILTIGLFGGSLAIAVLMAVVIICAKRHNKSTSTKEQTSENETSATCNKEGPTPTNGLKPSEEQVEIHYGEIDFSKLPLRDTPEGQEQGPGQETEYAEVRVSSRDAPATDQTGPDEEELYAKVQK